MITKLTPGWWVRFLLLEGRLIDRKFRRRWKTYLLQCGLATLALMLILLVMDVVLHTAIIVAIASSAFIVFVIPHSASSIPQRLLGGHIVAIMVGVSLSSLYLIPTVGEVAANSHVIVDLMAVVSVGLSILLMVLTNTEHPPAAGTALGLVIGGWDPSAVLFVLLGSIVLTVVHTVLRPHLTNLL